MKTELLLQKIEVTNLVTENEINLIKSRLNRGEKINLDYIWDNPIKLTDEQNTKGINFLKKLQKSRKNNPFGYREEDILNNFECFELAGYYDAGNYIHHFWVPLYNCCSIDNSFQYYYSAGKISIVG